MDKLAGTVIEARVARLGGTTSVVGPELRRLRLLSGLTQNQIATRMDTQQATVSKIEKGGKIYWSTVQRYVEALGVSLRVDARFPTDTPLSLKRCETFDVEQGDDGHLVLPILGDDSFRPQRDVVLSIKPAYSERILNGRKTVELRRRFPVSAPNGTLAYIYSTSPVKAMVGMVAIREVLKLPVEQIWSEFKETASIERDQFNGYFEGLEQGFALVFEDVKAFSRPLPLSELRKKFSFEPPQSFLYAKHDLRQALRDEPAIVSY